MAAALVQRGSLTASKVYRAVLGTAANPEAAKLEDFPQRGLDRSGKRREAQPQAAAGPIRDRQAEPLARRRFAEGHGSPRQDDRAGRRRRGVAGRGPDSARCATRQLPPATGRSGRGRRHAARKPRAAARARPGAGGSREMGRRPGRFRQGHRRRPERGFSLPDEGCGAGQVEEVCGGPCRPGRGPRHRPREHRSARGQGTDLRHAIELQGRRRRTDPGAGHRRHEPADPGTSGRTLRAIGREGQGPGRRREDPPRQAGPAERDAHAGRPAGRIWASTKPPSKNCRTCTR